MNTFEESSSTYYMTVILRSKLLLFLTFIWIVVLIYMSTLGYGSDCDSWIIARNAHDMSEAKTYLLSRSTGFPLYEIITLPLILTGRWHLTNLLSLIAGIVCLLGLMRLAGKTYFHHPDWVIIAFAFHPIIMINAGSTMDYLPALAFLIWSLYFLSQSRFYLAAILIGIGCGFRPINVFWIIPTIIYILQRTRNFKTMLKAMMLFFLTFAICYSPVLIKYGLILKAPGDLPLSFPLRVLYWGHNSLKLFGIIQSFILFDIFMYLIIKRKRLLGITFTHPDIIFHIINILIFTLLLFYAPDETEYLIPIIISIVFLFDRMMKRKSFILIVLVMLSYHLFRVDALGGESGNREIALSIKPGYLISDVRERIYYFSLRDAATNLKLSSPSVLMYGIYWIAYDNDKWEKVQPYGVYMYKQKYGNLYLSLRILDENTLKSLNEDGFILYVWNGRKYEYKRLKNTIWQNYVTIIYDLDKFFGTPLKGSLMQ